ncbi:hypothetical protein EST38_g2647 [Candolleomyces aberdarensis]|uniref:Uncharacterized protein n=1 Tax=Candolleomyces aberdarensis TaxID=2316362 RepID=A0A4Q2DU62_9AGAR|nr:hypothetical protein EST38_g2647 [Candolleomyces aberdarensis]
MEPTIVHPKPGDLDARTTHSLETKPRTRKRDKVKKIIKRARTRAGSFFLCVGKGLERYGSSPSLPEAKKERDPPIPPPKVTSENPSSPLFLFPVDDFLVVKRNSDLPIHTLPPELLTEVFAMACFSEVAATNTARRARTTPLTLGQVCRHWRQIVVSTPHLWSWVLIRLYRSKYDSQLEILKDWIGRASTTQPLTIELSFEDEDAWVARPPHELLQILLKEAHRWRSIDLTLPEACYQRVKSAKVQFPMLENIALQPLLADAHVAQAERKRLDVFEVVPSLTHLRLNGYYLDDCSIPWEQLQELVLQHIYVDECFYALQKAKNLVHCTLSTMLVNDCNRTVKKVQLTLPHLERLRVQGASGTDQATLIAHLTAPALSELIISSPNASAAFQDIAKMVSRSDCLLRTFEVNGFDMDETALVEMLNSLSTIEALHLVSSSTAPLESGLLDALRGSQTSTNDQSASSPPAATASATPAPKSFLPNLQSLEYEGDAAFEEEALMGMIRSRSGLETGRVYGSGNGMGSGGLVRKLKVVKLTVNNKSFSPDCQTLLSSLAG